MATMPKPQAGPWQGGSASAAGVHAASIQNSATPTAVKAGAIAEMASAPWPDAAPVDYLDNAQVLPLVREGLPYAAWEDLGEVVGIAQKELCAVMGIPPSTVVRRKRTGQFTPRESDRLARIARLAKLACSMMCGDMDATRAWLSTPRDLLDGETPLQRASTEVGARDVEELIGRLRHGIFS